MFVTCFPQLCVLSRVATSSRADLTTFRWPTLRRRDGGCGGVDVHHHHLVDVEGDMVLHRLALQLVQDVLERRVGRGGVVDGNVLRKVIDVFPVMKDVVQCRDERKGPHPCTLRNPLSKRLQDGRPSLVTHCLVTVADEIHQPGCQVLRQTELYGLGENSGVVNRKLSGSQERQRLLKFSRY